MSGVSKQLFSPGILVHAERTRSGSVRHDILAVMKEKACVWRDVSREQSTKCESDAICSRIETMLELQQPSDHPRRPPDSPLSLVPLLLAQSNTFQAANIKVLLRSYRLARLFELSQRAARVRTEHEPPVRVDQQRHPPFVVRLDEPESVVEPVVDGGAVHIDEAMLQPRTDASFLS